MHTAFSNKSIFLKKMLGFSMASWIGAILSFLILPIVTRTFVPEELGKINMFQTFYTMFFYISLLGLNQGFIRFYNEPIGRLNKNKLFKLCTIIAIAFTLVMSIFIFIIHEFLSLKIIGETELYIPFSLSLCILANVFLTLSNTLNRMEKNTFLFSVQAISIILIGKVSYLGAVFWNPTHKPAILIMSVSFFILAIFFAFHKRQILKADLGDIGKDEIIPLLKFSLPLVPVLFMSYLNTSLPKLMLIQYMDFEVIGIYSAAISIVTLITLLQSGFNIFWSPYVYENYIKHPDRLKKVHNVMTFSMVAFGLVILMMQDFLYLIIGNDYRESKQFFALLLVSPIFYTISETTGLGINISKKSYLNLVTTTITISVNLILCWFLIPKIGLVGAGIAVAISSSFMLFFKTILGQKYFNNITSYKKTAVTPLIFLISAYINLFMYDQFLYKLFPLIICLLILVIIYKEEVKYLFDFLQQILKNKRKNNV